MLEASGKEHIEVDGLPLGRGGVDRKWHDYPLRGGCQGDYARKEIVAPGCLLIARWHPVEVDRRIPLQANDKKQKI